MARKKALLLLTGSLEFPASKNRQKGISQEYKGTEGAEGPEERFSLREILFSCLPTSGTGRTLLLKESHCLLKENLPALERIIISPKKE